MPDLDAILSSLHPIETILPAELAESWTVLERERERERERVWGNQQLLLKYHIPYNDREKTRIQ